MAALLQPSKIREEEWDRHKDAIISLYLGIGYEESEQVEASVKERKGKTLDELAESMRQLHGFTASVSQYEARLKRWNARKNLKPEEWEPILDGLDALPRATKSRVVLSGRVVADSTISRARRYHKEKRGALNHVSTLDRLSLSSVSQQAHIEVQKPDGRWAQLSNVASTSLSGFSSPSALEADALVLPAPNSVSTTSTRLSFPVDQCHTLSNDNETCGASVHDGERLTSIQLSPPSTWLQQLPSRLLMGAALGGGFNGIARNRCASQLQDMPESITIEVQTLRQHYGSSNQGLALAETIPTSQDFQPQSERNQSVMTPDNVCRSVFWHFLVSVVMNGVSSLEDIPEEVLDGCLEPDGSLNSLLLSCFRDAPKHVVTTLASSFFQASIYEGKCEIITHLLRMGVCHANDTVILDRERMRRTPLEMAAEEGQELMLELLLSYGADPNKFYPNRISYHRTRGTHGALSASLYFAPHPYLGRRRPSIAIIRKLLQAGARVSPEIGSRLRDTEEAVVSCIAHHIPLSQHADFFKVTFWTSIIPYIEDIQGANLVKLFVSDCAERHGGQCMLRFQGQLDEGLIHVALKGHVETFLTVSPYSSHSSDFNAKLLSASICGRHPAIINSVMLRRPNINPCPHSLRLQPYEPNSTVVTSPLAEAIRSRNTDLMDLFTRANIFQSLHEGGRLDVALDAAIENGDIELVARILDSCPDLESQDMTYPIRKSIGNDREDLTKLLLRKGASVYSGKRPAIREPIVSTPRSITLLALKKGNLPVLRSLLQIGERQPIEIESLDLYQQLMRLTDPLITEDYLSSYHDYFRHSALNELLKQRDEVALIEENKLDFDLIPPSKCATVEFLTVCLVSAISHNNPALAQELIRMGANAEHKLVLIYAIKWTPSLLPFLLSQINHQRSVIPTGLGTDVLKKAIEYGPSRAEVVFNLIKSGLVDISDTGKPTRHTRAVTPLGVAIQQADVFPQFSYDTVELLLERGCDPNGIVSFQAWGRSDNRTAMLEAIKTRNQDLVRLLIKHGADVNTKLRHLVRRTPLQQAAALGDLAMVRLLLQHEANVNAEPCIALGGTALQFAAISGNCNVAAELLTHGALLHMPPSQIGGRWPIEGAAEHGRVDMIQLLWTANRQTFCIVPGGENGFQEKNFKKAMRLASDNGHLGCRDLIAELANLPLTATDIPPVVSPMYIDWPPPLSSVH
ncbi:ankyrin [Xylariaceae sp. FL1651]|nr:ankyrin [Xylariaceae sp. FL1651]